MAGTETNRKQFRLHWGKYFRSREVEPYIRSLENEVQGTQSRINALEEELKAAQETVDVKNRKIAELRRMTDDAEEKLKESGRLREEADLKLQQIDEESQKLLMQKEELHKTRLETNKRLNEAEQRGKEIRREAEEARAMQEQCMASLAEMQERNRLAQEAAESAESRRTQAIADAEAAEDSLSETTAELEKLQAQSRHIIEDADVQAEVAIREAKEKADRMVNEAKAESEHILNEAARISASNKSAFVPYQKRIEELEKELADLQAAALMDDSEAKILEMYKTRLDELEQENGRLKLVQADGSGAMLSQYQSRVEALEAENAKLRTAGSDPSVYLDRIAQLERENGQLKAGAPLGEDVSRYQQRIALLEKEILDLQQYSLASSQSPAIDALKANLEEAQRAYQDMLTQNQTLHRRIEQQEREIADYENGMQNGNVKDANLRARKIIQDALEESGRILDEAEMVRSRAFAATKAAYFNALMFRQKLAEQFTDIEQSLDDSLGILRSTDMVALSPRMGSDYAQDPRWNGGGNREAGR